MDCSHPVEHNREVDLSKCSLKIDRFAEKVVRRRYAQSLRPPMSYLESFDQDLGVLDGGTDGGSMEESKRIKRLRN